MMNSAEIVDTEPHFEITETLFADAYHRLKQVARRELKNRTGNTLNTTALVHEAYLKLAMNSNLSFDRAGKFFEYAAICMRHILINYATQRSCQKRGGGATHVDLTHPGVDGVAINPLLALQLDAGLKALEGADRRAAKVVELHFFSGLPLALVAEILGVVRRTVDRDWRYARAYLLAHADWPAAASSL
jgi:RNA polymerase sigma factor (TIGR02999 family)